MECTLKENKVPANGLYHINKNNSIFNWILDTLQIKRHTGSGLYPINNKQGYKQVDYTLKSNRVTGK